MPRKNNNTPIWLQSLGWYGLVAIITGFALVSFSVTEARSYIFQLLNLTGGLSIMASSLSKKDYPVVVLNGFWVLIALVTLNSL